VAQTKLNGMNIDGIFTAPAVGTPVCTQTHKVRDAEGHVVRKTKDDSNQVYLAEIDTKRTLT
jgi:hypothetical protein